ncbi:MAG: hypothetical protein C0596_10500 [Marinilabiliales bacterium]|nr:MAG: hypothetical protein C0596_10500 [Marinilabiliales bacterium]
MTFSTSCKKKELNTISGTLYDMATGEPVADAKVELDITEIVSGNFNSSFTPFMETYTDSEGNYLIEFESRNFVKMRLTYSKDEYHTVSTTFDPEGVDSDYEIDETIPMESYILVRVFNNTPTDSDDVLKFRLQNINDECDVCFSGAFQYFNGADIDTTFLCKVVGGESITVNYISIHNDVSNIVESQLYCTPGDTVNYNCYY